MINIDLHVHSKYSNELDRKGKIKPTSVTESLIEPEFIYNRAKERGMTHITITDHNSIDGCLELLDKGYENVLMGCENTVTFPDDDCKIHILTYGFNNEQYNEFNNLRNNLYEFRDYLHQNHIFSVVPHMALSLDEEFDIEHAKKLLVLFDGFELNGFLGRKTNKRIEEVIRNISQKELSKIADKYDINNPLTNPDNKFLTAGSDDHAGPFIATSYTYINDEPDLEHKKHNNSIDYLLINPTKAKVKVHDASPKDLAYSMYSVIYQDKIENKGPKKKKSFSKFLSTLDHILTLKPQRKIGMDLGIVIDESNFVQGDEGLKRLIKDIKKHSKNIGLQTHNNAPKTWFDVSSKAVYSNFYNYIEEMINHYKNDNIYPFFGNIGHVFASIAMASPFYLSYKTFNETENFSKDLDLLINKPTKNIKVAYFSDGIFHDSKFNDVQERIARAGKELGLDFEILTCSDETKQENEIIFKPLFSKKIFDQEITFPPFLDIIDYCHEKGFDYIHSLDFGPMGILGSVCAKALDKKFYINHQDLEKKKELPKEEDIDRYLNKVRRIFYESADKIFVKGHISKMKLFKHGYDRKRIDILPKALNFRERERFYPELFNNIRLKHAVKELFKEYD